ncbi:hypothetical protein ACFW0H_26410 [Pseudomonas sp. CR3202]|uniref:hypothetical protein n=1 Tax=Pseudomonas sp. CR3202 TaxID=3351532 RepID=UPI003BEFD513
MWADGNPEANLASRVFPIGKGKLRCRATLACLFLSLAAPVKAESRAPVRTFGDWSVLWVQESVNLMAVTLDNYGNYIALRCLVQEQRCLHVLSVNASCQAEVSYPVLISSGTISRALGFSCRDAESSTELVADEQSEIHEIWRRDGFLGISMAVTDGHFKNARFSMKGAFEAMEYVKKYTREQDDVEIEL